MDKKFINNFKKDKENREVNKMLKGIIVIAGVLTYFFIAYYSLFTVSTDLIQMVA